MNLMDSASPDLTMCLRGILHPCLGGCWQMRKAHVLVCPLEGLAVDDYDRILPCMVSIGQSGLTVDRRTQLT